MNMFWNMSQNMFWNTFWNMPNCDHVRSYRGARGRRRWGGTAAALMAATHSDLQRLYFAFI